jgi:DNA anti-recombination protein RmuC
VNTLSRFDEKIKKVQQQVLQVTDEYNATVTNRLKEVSAGFIKQVNDLDGKHREHHREL